MKRKPYHPIGYNSFEINEKAAKKLNVPTEAKIRVIHKSLIKFVYNFTRNQTLRV